MFAADALTLGLLAGGRDSRPGGVDRAWLQRGGIPQVLRFARRFPGETGPVLVSASRDLQRYVEAGLQAVPERLPVDAGPLAGIEALAAACTTPWLLSLPLDLFDVNDCLVRSLASGASAAGAVAADEDGLQPWVALYRVQALRAGLAAAIAAGERTPAPLQARLALPVVRFAGVRFGRAGAPPLAARIALAAAASGKPT